MKEDCEAGGKIIEKELRKLRRQLTSELCF
jgi:hypothetical protein